MHKDASLKLLADFDSQQEFFRDHILPDKMSLDALSWQQKILQLGIRKDVYQTLLNTETICNYKNLYRSLRASSPFFRINLHALPNNLWQLLCLSAEPLTIEYAINNNLIDKATEDSLGVGVISYLSLSGNADLLEKIKFLIRQRYPIRNMKRLKNNYVHYAALSGVPPMLDGIISINNYYSYIKNFINDDSGRSILHYAAWSGAPLQLDKVINLNLDIDHDDNWGVNIIHYAAMSGIPEQIDKAINLGWKVDKKTKSGQTLLHYAAWSGMPAQLDKAIDLGFDLYQQDNLGLNILHYAALSGMPDQLSRVINLGLDIHQKDSLGRNILHYAAWSGNPAQIKKVFSLFAFNPFEKDYSGHDAFWFIKIKNSHLDYMAARVELEKHAFGNPVDSGG